MIRLITIMLAFETHLSLEELEGDFRGDSPWALSTFDRIYNLRRIPLRELDKEEMLFLLSQRVGERYFVPLLLPFLEIDPLHKVEYYRGDLLEVVLSVDPALYFEFPELLKRVVVVARKAYGYFPFAPEGAMEPVNAVIGPLLKAYLEAFDEAHASQRLEAQFSCPNAATVEI